MWNSYFVSKRWWFVLGVLALAFPGLGFARPRGQSNGRPCLQAARRWLGASAKVVKCGHLTGPESTEVVAILPLSGHQKYPDLYYASKFVSLRRTGPDTWTEELGADEWGPRDCSGYIGAGPTISVEDLEKRVSYGYGLSFDPTVFADDPSNAFNNRPYFTVSVTYLNPQGEMEGSEVEISWNPKVRRFQEFNYQVGFFIPATPYPKPCGPPAHGCSPVAPGKHP